MDSGKKSVFSPRPISLCTQSVTLPVFLQHIISSVTVGSKAPCLEEHIQSCRLKQIAICMLLGEKKQREAPFFIPTLHLAEFSLFEPPNPLFFFSLPPAAAFSARHSQSNHSNQCFSCAKPIGKWLPKQKSECPVIIVACNLVVLANGCLDSLFKRLGEQNNCSLGQNVGCGGSTKTNQNDLFIYFDRFLRMCVS